MRMSNPTVADLLRVLRSDFDQRLDRIISAAEKAPAPARRRRTSARTPKAALFAPDEQRLQERGGLFTELGILFATAAQVQGRHGALTAALFAAWHEIHASEVSRWLPPKDGRPRERDREILHNGRVDLRIRAAISQDVAELRATISKAQNQGARHHANPPAPPPPTIEK